MDYLREWQDSLPNQFPDQAGHHQPRTFPTNISSYFRRPAKVVKTSSRGNSPKTLSRRRTTASHSTRQHGVLNGSISNFDTPHGYSNDSTANTRPISWHPNSMKPAPVNEWTFPYQLSDSACAMPFLTNPFVTTEVNGLITPLSQSSSAESCYQEGFTPLEELHMPNLDNTYSVPKQAGYNAFWPPQHSIAPHYAVHTPSMCQGTFPLDQSTTFTTTSIPDMYNGTGPPTPDFLANKNGAVVEKMDSLEMPPSEDEVLVGMGLYDGPSPPSSTALHGGQISLPHRGSAGKGLKLEETFQPTNEDGSDDDDDDGGSFDDEPEDVPTQQSITTTTYQPVTSPVTNMLADRSFFFDNDPDEDQLLVQAQDHHFTTPIWTDVYSGAPLQWI